MNYDYFKHFKFHTENFHLVTMISNPLNSGFCLNHFLGFFLLDSHCVDLKEEKPLSPFSNATALSVAPIHEIHLL